MYQGIAKVYDPTKVEEKWYQRWLEKKYFHATVDKEKEPFTIVIPPPNVTGSLHMGHALNNTLQDIIIRKKRMDGFVTLWLPGTDHAGIATQNVVEQELAKEGKTRDDLGREKFVARVWKWKEKYGSQIVNQLKRLGCSCDWDRERFTMDEGCSRAVREVFVQLYKEGLIYQGNYIINWCPRCLTALSDIEVEYHKVRGRLWYIRYPFKDGEDYLVIATTRPETLLGDTAVAVHPSDKRYKEHTGRTVILPVLGREIPVIADCYVDRKFGTGALKITPAHDPNDFEIGRRHHLPEINIFTPDAKVNENGGRYQGMDRYECRKQIVKDLEKNGLLEKVEDYSHAVGHCYRCDTVVEPYLSRQWFVKMKPLADPAIRAVKKGEVKFFPKRWEKIYFEWMNNIRDWCISRQIWWGHQIPAWYCKEMKNSKCKMKEGIIVRRVEPKECPYCKSNKIVQDRDVLDTWFSSALWPFSTLGWPEKTKDLTYFYPTTLLSTGFDIIYFWVARMIMMGLHFVKQVPFRTVYIHALIRDVEGKKMSKSRGNVIDPIEVIDRYGTDALRFTLASLATPGRDVYLSEEQIQGYRNFINKIWNASRFVLANLQGYQPAEAYKEKLEFSLADRWILSRFARAVSKVDRLIETFHFSKAAKVLYDFFWSDFCDWYIELCKPRLYGQELNRRSDEGKDTAKISRLTAQHVLYTVLEGTLRLLHPIIPFVTEEIWQRLPRRVKSARLPVSESARQRPKAKPMADRRSDGRQEGQGSKIEESIMMASYPKACKSLVNKTVEAQMSLIQTVTTSIRSIRSSFNIPPLRQVEVFMSTSDKRKVRVIRAYSHYISQLASVSELVISEDVEKPDHSAVAVEHGVEIFVPLAELLDVNKEVKRLEKKLGEIEDDLRRVSHKLKNKDFLNKAPKRVIEKEKSKSAILRDKREKIIFQLEQIK